MAHLTVKTLTPPLTPPEAIRATAPPAGYYGMNTPAIIKGPGAPRGHRVMSQANIDEAARRQAGRVAAAAADSANEAPRTELHQKPTSTFIAPIVVDKTPESGGIATY